MTDAELQKLYPYAYAHTKLLDENARGHQWQRSEHVPELVDEFAADDSYWWRYCNGPKCVNCGYQFCRHCHKNIPPQPCPVQAPGPKEAHHGQEETRKSKPRRTQRTRRASARK